MVVRSLIFALSMVLMACYNNHGGKSQPKMENNDSKVIKEKGESLKDSN